MARPILFLTDYGLEGEYVGLCHTVVARLAPDVRVIDVTHTIPRHSIRAGAVVLSTSVRFGPEDAVWLAVVDPGVGAGRRAVMVRTADGPWLVGPDNGLLSLAWHRLGGAEEVVELDPETPVPWHVSLTFHGRDVFAPAAARVAGGEDPRSLGRPADPSSLVALQAPSPTVRDQALVAEVIDVDGFGNVRLGATFEDLVEAGLTRTLDLVVRAGGRVVAAQFGETFANVADGEYVVLVDSSGYLAVARNQGDAAEGLAVALGDAVALSAEAVE